MKVNYLGPLCFIITRVIILDTKIDIKQIFLNITSYSREKIKQCQSVILISQFNMFHLFLQGLTSLHLASIHGRLDCLRLLIEKYKFDINLPSTTGWRACHLCISNQTGKRAHQCLAYLLEKKADPSL